MMKVFLLALLAAVLAFPAAAQQFQRLPPGVPCGQAQPPAGMSPGYMDAFGNQCVSPGTAGAGGGAAGAVTLVPPTGTPVEVTVTCGVTTTALLAAAAATQFVLIKSPTGAAATVWINAAGVAAVAAPPSIDLVAGASLLWSPGNGFVPSSAINCIASIATAVTLVYK
jgi:hypothetical protein